MSKVHAGFIGAGQFISFSHLPVAMQSPIMEIRTIADVNPATLDNHRAAMPDVRFTTDYREVLKDPEIDLVIIGTRQDLHAKLIIESLDAGKWVYCEKPMAETPEESLAVRAAEKRNCGKLGVGLNRRFAPAYVRAKDLMQRSKRPWLLHYRLMAPHLTTGEKDEFYRDRPRIIYEGCHILDLVCWFFDASPTRVYMTGDRTRNNTCILQFADGSNVTFVCGSIGSFCLTKEYMEVFAEGHSIAVSDFVDMRVRGFQGEADQLFPLDSGAYADEIAKFGFDYYEVCRTKEILSNPDSMRLISGAGMAIEELTRPLSPAAKEAVGRYAGLKKPYYDNPDKGRRQALEHFAQMLLEGGKPQNCNGYDGARSTEIGLALLRSLESGVPVEYRDDHLK